jgi:hypothetical protein
MSSSQAGFVTKNGNLSAKALKRFFKDGVQPKKIPKRQKVARAEPSEAKEGENEEISAPDTFRGSVEDLNKKKRHQEATKKI